MTILSVTNIAKSFGIQQVLKDISFGVEDGDKIGLIGANGTGKTTLLDILCGRLAPDEGAVSLSRSVSLGYMEQYVEYTSEKTVLEEALTVFQELLDMERRLQVLESQLILDHSAETIHKHHELNERFADQGGLTFRSRANAALIGLGFTPEELSLPLSAVSGGERTRVLLAKMLLGSTNLLLLDEPTNHLDIRATAWLEEYLAEYRGTLLIISHDRYFLDRVTNRIFYLQNGRLEAYKGNYTAFLRQKNEADETKRREYDNKTKEIRRLEGIIAQQKQWNRERNLVTARSKQKAVDRIAATLEAPEKQEGRIKFSFQTARPSGNEVLLAEDVAKFFDGKPLFSGTDLDIRKGQRAFLLGDNGCGKTTLFRILLGRMAADSGCIRLGAGVRIGYYDQAQSDLMMDKTVLENLSEELPWLNLGVLRNALAAFLFYGEDVNKKVGVLSGGEKARVSLARLMLSKCNLLLLDEPTNHLDIESKEVLEEALLSYEGTLFIISHDRYFINRLATHIYLLRPDGTQRFEGDYSQFMERMAAPESRPSAPKEKKVNNYILKKERASREKRLAGKIARLEQRIDQVEGTLAALQAGLADPDIASDYQTLLAQTEKIQVLEKELQMMYNEWEEYSSQI